jgi:hypothetical protein
VKNYELDHATPLLPRTNDVSRTWQVIEVKAVLYKQSNGYRVLNESWLGILHFLIFQLVQSDLTSSDVVVLETATHLGGTT